MPTRNRAVNFAMFSVTHRLWIVWRAARQAGFGYMTLFERLTRRLLARRRNWNPRQSARSTRKNGRLALNSCWVLVNWGVATVRIGGCEQSLVIRNHHASSLLI